MRHAKPRETGKIPRRLAVGGALTLGAAAVPAATAGAATVSQWDRIAACESGDSHVAGSGHWNLPYGDADSTGGLQIQLRTWNAFGGQEFASAPYLATKAEQIEVAERILAKQGASAWVCNLPGHGVASGALGSGTGQSYLKGGPAPYGATSTPAPVAPAKVPVAPLVRDAPAPAHTDHYTVVSGDTLFRIARQFLGDGEKWPSVYDANRDVVGGNPNLIYPGQVLDIPEGRRTVPAPPVDVPTRKVVAPVEGRFSQEFKNPGDGYSLGYHTGIDISAPTGTPVVAATAGVVVASDTSSAYGTNVQIRHTDGRYTLYAHLSAKSVAVGQTVAAGTRIGSVGSTGHSSGAHLHFELRIKPVFAAGNFLDPAAWLRSNGVAI